jgi:hypothetical protein
MNQKTTVGSLLFLYVVEYDLWEFLVLIMRIKMAITPIQAKELTEEEKSLVKKQESEIDDYLRRNFNDGSVTIEIRGSTRVVDQLVKTYQQCGWTLQRNGEDQSGVVTYTFTETQHSYDYYNR